MSCDKDDMTEKPDIDDDDHMEDNDSSDEGSDDETYNIEIDSQAVITNVIASGSEGSYTFNVEIKSPDTGCDQYADWWEVFTVDSNLVYRRILAHSHINEQPFSRSGGPVTVNKDDQVFVRGHMNNLGYGSLVMRGSVEAGFAIDTLSISYAQGLELTEPLPEDCDF